MSRSSPSSGRGAALVALGIFASRVFGLVRERVLADYLGNSVAAAAFKAGLRIPNFLQNLFGEGVLSASFIPVYAELLGKGQEEEADRLASAIFALLSLLVAVLVLAGLWASPYLVDFIAPGFRGEGRELTLRIVRILFPGTGMLVLSAWCLGVLNSHRRFFLSYAAPVLWNLAIIGAVLLGGRMASLERLAELAAWGTLAGSALQLLVQLPAALRALRRFRPRPEVRSAPVRQVLASFLPVLLSRGVVQVSAYVDTAYASLISARALASLTYAQTLYLLPVSLFGMAVSAAELPELSRDAGDGPEALAKLRARLEQGLVRIAFFVVPSAAALVALGDVLAAALFQTGRFEARDARFLWYLLLGAGFGLLASTMGRLYASAFYALKDTRTPLYFALVRVCIGAAGGYAAGFLLPPALGVPGELGAAGLTLVSSLAAWLELAYLRHRLARRIGPTRLPAGRLWRLLAAATFAAALALSLKLLLVHLLGADLGSAEEWGGALLPPPRLAPIPAALVIAGLFGAAYFAAGALFGVPQARAVFARLLRR